MVGLGYKTSRTEEQLEQVRCKRCELYHEKDLTDCPNCSQLDETQLQTLKDHLAEQAESNSRLGRYLLFALAIVLLLTVLVSVF